MKLPRSMILVFLAGLTAVLSAACTTAGPAPSPENGAQGTIEPLVEDLYLKAKNLETTYQDLRAVANAQAFQPDDLQLSHIQKVALYVEHAVREAFHQWEFLSIMADIKPAAMQDYFTLRYKALGKAVDETGYDMRFVKLYQAFITNAEAEKSIRDALSNIGEIQTIYKQLIVGLAPLVRKGLPTPI